VVVLSACLIFKDPRKKKRQQHRHSHNKRTNFDRYLLSAICTTCSNIGSDFSF
jgi:hypothetical protein